MQLFLTLVFAEDNVLNRFLFHWSSASESYKAVANTIMNILPLTSYTAHGPLTLDYLPMLRAISQAEQCRQLAKVKRR